MIRLTSVYEIDILSLMRSIQDSNSPKIVFEIKCTTEFSVTPVGSMYLQRMKGGKDE